MINYKGKEYWSTELVIPGRGEVTIASTELEEILLTDMAGSSKAANAANYLDESIYYYLTEEEQQMDKKKMVKYIKGETT